MSLISQSCSDFVCAKAVLMAILLTGPTGLYMQGGTPMLHMFAACALMVATIIVLLRLTDMEDACCPLQMSFCRFPVSCSKSNVLNHHPCTVYFVLSPARLTAILVRESCTPLSPYL